MALNDAQKLAVETIDGPVLVIAGAGSGKTRVVISRILNLLDSGVASSKILGLTFTNKAASEMKERILRERESNVIICTFHSLGARILREFIHKFGSYDKNFTIYDEEDVDKLLKICLKDLHVDEKVDLRSLRSLISSAKNGLYSPDQMDSSHLEAHVARLFSDLYQLYQKKLQEYNATDYDDLLLLTLRLFKEHPDVLEHYQNRWSHLLIDEYQDTNAVQYAIVDALVAKHKNLCVVGDPDQSIYSWRGANIQNILNFESDFPGAKVIKLNQNYRSHENILDAANALISNNAGRYEKALWSTLGPGEKITIARLDDERKEAFFVTEHILSHHRDNISFNEMVVFYRTNAQSRALEDQFLKLKIPYVIVGGISFYHRREIKDVFAWLKMILSDSDYLAFLRTINLPKRGVGQTTLEKLYQGASCANLPIITFIERLLTGDSSSIKLTIRQKQGLNEYLSLLHSLKNSYSQLSLSYLVQEVIKKTGYEEFLREDRETYDDRIENLNALINKSIEWEAENPNGTLTQFLEELSLKSTLDEAHQDQDQVHLMTIHNGKGLEFKITFLVGMEEDLFPHINSKDNLQAVEEERRLCYVGMTRAKQKLYLSHVISRTIWGVTRSQRKSRFIREIPEQYIETAPQNGFSRSANFSKGDLVFHREFGIGRIQDAYEGMSGLTYQISFTKDNSIKNIVAKYATLELLK